MAERLAGGNQAIALLGNTIPTGAILVVLISILGPVSGAHFNPAVSLVFAARGVARRGAMLLPYIVVQCVGGDCGHRPRAPDVRACAAHDRHHDAQRCIAMARRSGRHLHAAAGDPRRHPARAAGRAVAGRSYDHRGLLVHVFDVVRQPGGDAGARFHHDIFGHRLWRCPRPSWLRSWPEPRWRH